MVRLLDRTQSISLATRPARTLHDSHSAAQRHGHASHGTHAQQHVAGCPGAPRAHAGKERLLGAGHRPRLDSHRSQGRRQAQSRGHRQVVAHARGVPRPRMGVEGEARRHNPQTAAQAGRLVRLGAHMLHDGRRTQRGRHKGLLRPVRQGSDLSRRAHGQLGPRCSDRTLGRGGGIQGVAGQALLSAL